MPQRFQYSRDTEKQVKHLSGPIESLREGAVELHAQLDRHLEIWGTDNSPSKAGELFRAPTRPYFRRSLDSRYNSYSSARNTLDKKYYVLEYSYSSSENQF
jgi:hypothetical protein